jgi:hypothetical protein
MHEIYFARKSKELSIQKFQFKNFIKIKMLNQKNYLLINIMSVIITNINLNKIIHNQQKLLFNTSSLFLNTLKFLNLSWIQAKELLGLQKEQTYGGH